MLIAHCLLTGSTAFRNAHFGPGSGNIFMDDVHCSGYESQLKDCLHTSTHDCGNHEDASVECQTGNMYVLVSQYSFIVYTAHIMIASSYFPYPNK